MNLSGLHESNARVVVTRPAQADGLGQSSGQPIAVASLGGDLQESAVERASTEGGVQRVGDATFFTSSVDGVEPGDSATVHRANGTTQTAIVAEVERLDDRLILTYR